MNVRDYHCVKLFYYVPLSTSLIIKNNFNKKIGINFNNTFFSMPVWADVVLHHKNKHTNNFVHSKRTMLIVNNKITPVTWNS